MRKVFLLLLWPTPLNALPGEGALDFSMTIVPTDMLALDTEHLGHGTRVVSVTAQSSGCEDATTVVERHLIIGTDSVMVAFDGLGIAVDANEALAVLLLDEGLAEAGVRQ